MVCFPICLSKHHTKIHMGEYSNCVCVLNFVPAVHGHKMSAVYPGHIISDAHCIGGWVGPRAGLEVVKKRLTPTPLRKVAVFLLYNPALPKQRSKKHRGSVRTVERAGLYKYFKSQEKCQMCPAISRTFFSGNWRYWRNLHALPTAHFFVLKLSRQQNSIKPSRADSGVKMSKFFSLSGSYCITIFRVLLMTWCLGWNVQYKNMQHLVWIRYRQSPSEPAISWWLSYGLDSRRIVVWFAPEERPLPFLGSVRTTEAHPVVEASG
jgi:hypothetical protein